MDDRTIDSIFAGSLESLPPVSSKIVRIFTSSTFTGVCVFFFNFGAIDCISLWNLLVDLEILTMFRYHNGAQYADGEVLSTH